MALVGGPMNVGQIGSSSTRVCRSHTVASAWQRSMQPCRVVLPSRHASLGSCSMHSSSRAPLLPARSHWQAHIRSFTVVAAAADAAGGEQKRGFIQKLTKSIRDFGFGKKSLVEGGVGMFVFTGIGVLLMVITWARGGQLFSRGRGYNCILEFPTACGIMTGTPVRIRGVTVGSTLTVQPSLERVDVFVEIKDTATVIPRNALIEANQSGLIAESLIDITPQTPIPDWRANPLEEECEAEGQVVCHQGRIKGRPGVSMDDLVYMSTNIMRQFEGAGMDRVMEGMETLTQAIEDARPLLHRAIELADQVTPLMQDLRQGDLVGNLEALTRSAAQAAADIHKLQNEVLTEENVEALRGSVGTLAKTLEHVEAISGDVGGLTADSKVKANLKQLIEALSRLSTD